MKESKKLALFEGLAGLFALLAVASCSFTAYVEGSTISISMFQLIFGSQRTDPNGLVIFGFALLILSVAISLVCAVLCYLEKYVKDLVVMILGISGGLSALIGGVLVTCAILLTGLDKQNSELGFIQGNWGLGAADFLIPLSCLASLALSYPAALLIAHHADLKDKNEKKAADKGEDAQAKNPVR